MLILPAIDLKDGRCVRLEQGKPDKIKVYSGDPAAVAKDWEQQGAEWLHVVDLDGAFAGEPRNLAALEAIRAAISVPIQFGGGNRTMDTLQRVFDAGADRVVLGTAALQSPEFLGEACEKFGERIAVGIDARDGSVAVEGWSDVTNVEAVEFLLGKGAAIDAANRVGNSPLHYAAFLGWPEVAETLLARDADPAARNHGGLTPRDVAVAMRRDEVVKTLFPVEAAPKSILPTATSDSA